MDNIGSSWRTVMGWYRIPDCEYCVMANPKSSGSDEYYSLYGTKLSLRSWAKLWLGRNRPKASYTNIEIKNAVRTLRARMRFVDFQTAFETHYKTLVDRRFVRARELVTAVEDTRRDTVKRRIAREPWPIERIPSWERLSAILAPRI